MSALTILRVDDVLVAHVVVVNEVRVTQVAVCVSVTVCVVTLPIASVDTTCTTGIATDAF